MWKRYQQENPNAPKEYDAWAFGDTKEMANKLADLVLAGVKTATASNYLMYDLDQEQLPFQGLHNIILDGSGNPVAIAVTTAVRIVSFNEVTAEHAYLEGEGDRTLQYWRDAHEAFFKKEMEAINQDFHTSIPIVCERFKVVYK